MAKVSRGKVVVPDVPAPPKVCWKQQVDPKKPYMMFRCMFRKNHNGPHQWEKRECPTQK